MKPQQLRTVGGKKLGDGLLNWVEKAVEKPAKELEDVAPLWESLVPAEGRRRAKLVSFREGVLRVAVESAPARAFLQMLLKGGVERAMKEGTKGKLFKVKTYVVAGGEERGSE